MHSKSLMLSLKHLLNFHTYDFNLESVGWIFGATSSEIWRIILKKCFNEFNVVHKRNTVVYTSRQTVATVSLDRCQKNKNDSMIMSNDVPSEQVFAAGDKNRLPGQSPKEQQSLSIDRYRNVDIFSEILLLANKEKPLPSGTTAAIVFVDGTATFLNPSTRWLASFKFHFRSRQRCVR